MEREDEEMNRKKKISLERRKERGDGRIMKR